MFVGAVLCKVVRALVLKEMACLLNTWKLFFLWYFIRQHTCVRFKAGYALFFFNVKPLMSFKNDLQYKSDGSLP
jgi:hypothetical protein